MTETKAIHKAVRMIAMAELQREGLLDRMTAKELGALLGCDPATAFRARRDLKAAQALAPAIVATARAKLAQESEGKP